jgi:Zn-dependent peptidase ImmA (M78 family)
MKRQAEVKAKELLERLHITQKPVNPGQIAKKLGIKVIEDELPDEFSGVLYQKNPKAVTIILNKAQSPKRKRFSIAHEIGHFEMKHQTEVHVDKKMLFRNEVSAAAIDPIEIDANAFAAELLMPAEWVKTSYRELVQKSFSDEDDFLSELAGLYEVSTAAMSYRLKNLGLSIS